MRPSVHLVIKFLFQLYINYLSPKAIEQIIHLVQTTKIAKLVKAGLTTAK